MKQILAVFLLILSVPTFAQTDTRGIAASEELTNPVKEGHILPNTCLQDLHKNTVCTDEMFAKKPTVLVIYRGGWCPYCSAQLSRLRTIENQLTELGFQIVAVSPDSNKNLKQLKNQADITYTLLTDNELNLSKQLGLAFFLSDDVAKKYRNRLGVPFVDIDGTEKVSLPVPAVYIFDQNKQVRYQFIDTNFRVRLDEDELLQQATKLSKK